MARIPMRIEREILSSFNSGVVPRQGTGFVQVGRNAEFRSIKRDLDSAGQKEGMGTFRFIVGNYGAGKSFMLQFIREFSINNNFVVMDADLTPDRRFTGSNKEGLKLYRELIKNLSTKAFPTGGALEPLLNKWIDTIRKGISEECQIDPENVTDSQIITEIRKRTYEVSTLPIYSDFIRMVTNYWRASKNQSQENPALNWLKGDYEQRSMAKQDLGVGVIVDNTNWYQFIRIWSKFIVSIGYRGLVVIFDEGTILGKMSSSKARENNYECILTMYNDINTGNTRNLAMYMSETPMAVDDRRRGLYSYDALRTRLEPGRFVNGYNNQYGPVMTLRYLDQPEMEALLTILRDIHAHVYKYEATVTQEMIHSFVYEKFRDEASGQVTPREMSRSFLGVLDVLYQNDGLSFPEIVGTVRVIGDTYSISEDIYKDLEV